MAAPLPEPVHTNKTFEDLSGVSTSEHSNPFHALIVASKDDPAQLQKLYTAHRTTRNTQQKEKMLDKSFTGPIIDPILLRLSDPTIEPGYVDPRHCLVIWGRPTTKIKQVIDRVQQELFTLAPTLEITHSRKAEEIQDLVEQLRDWIPNIANFTQDHRARLIKPMIGFDASALALTFVPAAAESLSNGRTLVDDQYTYHHLRGDLFNVCREAGVKVDSRYVVPAAHLTIARFIDPKDFENEGTFAPQKMKHFIEKIEEINGWLQNDYWPEFNGGKIPDGGEWILGEEKGLSCRKGALWYGGGEPFWEGKGF